ncbi:MAG: PIG-L family deacetylase [Planctomycetota bacterium]|nr:PIG-L family deacetylase [Planctomycetota bacterium]
MKPIQTSTEKPAPLLVFGAHPDDIEFGCGGVVARETSGGRSAHFVVCSRGEAASHGTPEQRQDEARKSAGILGATIEFIELGGDAHLEVSVARTIQVASVIRRIRPGIVLGPTLNRNQHPDHSQLGHMVQDAARLARYAGMDELRGLPPHAIDALLFYAITPEAEPKDCTAMLIDVSAPEIMGLWTAAMTAHASQVAARSYVEMQLNRARLRGLSAGVTNAIALFAADPLVVDSLANIRGARGF